MRRPTLPLAAAAALVLATGSLGSLDTATAITAGSPDDGAHPMVGLMSAQTADGEPLFRCTGTLVSPTVLVTAGHCTSDGGADVGNVELWFGAHYETDSRFLTDVADATERGDPSCEDDDTGERYAGFPCTGEVSGSAHTHPAFDPAQFWLRDLGVVVLDEPVVSAGYAELPPVGAFDGWRPQRKQTFTAVGYGLQADYPAAAGKDRSAKTRMVAEPRLITVNSPSVGDHGMRLSNNARTGGTCSGDSGGPNFVGDGLVIAGVTSYGMSMQTCGGNGGIYRLDRAEDRAWLAGFLS